MANGDILQQVPGSLEEAVRRANEIAYGGRPHNTAPYWAEMWGRDPAYTWRRMLGDQATYPGDLPVAGPFAGQAREGTLAGMAQLPPGYETGYGYGGGQYPLYAAAGPGLAAPFNVAFQAPDPRSLEQYPAYQWMRQEGLDAIQRSAAAKGTLLTGGTMKDLAGWTAGLASTEYDKIYQRALGEYQQAYNIFQGQGQTLYNRLAGLAGGTPQVAGTVANLGQQYAGSYGTLLGAGADARAAGIMGSAGAWQPFYGSLAGLAQAELLRRTQPLAE